MPRKVDHNERRHQLAEAIWRLTSRDGLEVVSLRQVAAEAGVSTGMVQHYFRTKDEMLQFALAAVSDRVAERIFHRVSNLVDPAEPRQLLRAVLIEMLPLDEQRRIEAQVGFAFLARATVQPRIAARLLEGVTQLEDFLADQIRLAQQSEKAPANLDPRREAVALLALVDGLTTHALARRHAVETVLAVLDSQLDHLFTPR